MEGREDREGCIEVRRIACDQREGGLSRRPKSPMNGPQAWPMSEMKPKYLKSSTRR